MERGVYKCLREALNVTIIKGDSTDSLCGGVTRFIKSLFGHNSKIEVGFKKEKGKRGLSKGDERLDLRSGTEKAV